MTPEEREAWIARIQDADARAVRQGGLPASVAANGRDRISDETLDDWYRRWPSILPTSVPHEQVRMLIEDVRDAREEVSRLHGEIQERIEEREEHRCEIANLKRDLREALRVVRFCERVVSEYERRAADPETMGGDLVEISAFSSYMAARTALGAIAVDDGDQVRSAWAEFGVWCLKEMRYPCPGDIDGGAAQDEAERLGLIIRVPMSKPCGENCYCAELHGDAPWECLREAPTVDDGDRGRETVVAQKPAPTCPKCGKPWRFIDGYGQQCLRCENNELAQTQEKP